MAIPKNNNNNYNNYNNNYNNNKQNNYNNYNNNQNNNNNQNDNNNYKKYNNMYIYVPSFCVNFESKYAVSIKNILPSNLGFWISKSRIYDTKEYDNTINVLTLSIDMDKNVRLDTKPKEQEIKPNQLIQAYQVLMSKLSDVFAHEEHINKYLKEHYDFHNKNVIEQQIIYNQMIGWKQAMETNQEKQEFYASKQNGNNNNNQNNNIDVVDINNINNQTQQNTNNNNDNYNNQNNNNNQEQQSTTVINLDNLGNL